MKAPLVLMPRWRCQSYITKTFIHTLYHEYLMNIFASINFAACRQNPELKEWVMIDYDCCSKRSMPKVRA